MLQKEANSPRTASPPPRAQRSGSRRNVKKFPPQCSFRRSRKRNGGGNFWTGGERGIRILYDSENAV